MGAVIAFITAALQYVPKLIEIGEDVAPYILQARAAVDNLGTLMSPDDAEFKKLDAAVAVWETDFKDAIAAHLAAVGQPATG